MSRADSRNRWIQLVAVFLAGAAVMALVAVLAGLWNKTSSPVILNTDKVAAAIQASIRAQRNLTSTVVCPVNIVQHQGGVFRCTATVRGRNFPVVVTQTDGRGHVRFIVT